MSSQIFFFNSKVKENFNKLSKSEVRSILIASIIVMIFTSGIKGIYTEAFNRATYTYGSYPYSNSYSYLNLNPIFFITSSIVQIVFFVLLIFFHRLIYTNNEIKTNLNDVDIIILLQLSIFRDVLYLVYIYIHMALDNQYTTSWSGISDTRSMELFLYVIFIILVMFYLIPRIMPRLEVTRKDFNRGLLLSLFISMAIVISLTIAINTFQLIINIPFANQGLVLIL